MTDLFRRQALDHQRQKFHGAIILVRSPWRSAVAAGFVTLVGGLVAFAATQGFARQETVPGVLLPSSGVLRLVAPQAGVVQPGGAAQGTEVRAGQLVAALSSDLATAAGPAQALVAQSLQARRAQLGEDQVRQAEQARLRQAALAARVDSLRASLAEQDRLIALQRERVRVARDVADRYPALVRSGAVSPVEAAERRNDLLDQQARLATLAQARLAGQRELDEVSAERAAQPLAAGRERSALQRESEALAQQEAETQARRQALVTAPEAGRIAARLVPAGQAVAAGQAIATLLPAGAHLEAELYVPSRAAGFVRPGTPVWLRVDAFPYQRFGQIPAHVREVAQAAVPRDEIDPGAAAAGPEAAGAGVYRVRVALDVPPATAPGGGATPAPAWLAALKAGMHVQASLEAERRTLLAWAFEPLAGLRGATPPVR